MRYPLPSPAWSLLPSVSVLAISERSRTKPDRLRTASAASISLIANWLSSRSCAAKQCFPSLEHGAPPRWPLAPNDALGIRHSGPLLRVTGVGELRRSPCVLAFPASELRTRPPTRGFRWPHATFGSPGSFAEPAPGGFGHLLAMHLHGAIRTANCYSRALNVKRMGRYLKIIMAVPAWTPPSAPRTSQTDPPKATWVPKKYRGHDTVPCSRS